MASKQDLLAENIGRYLLSLRQNNPSKTQSSLQTITKLVTQPDAQSFLLHELNDLQAQHRALVGPIHSINRELQEHLCDLQNDFDDLEASQEDLLIDHTRLEKRYARRKAENKSLYEENCELRTASAEDKEYSIRLRQKYERVVRKNDELTKTLVETRNSLADLAENGRFDSTAMAGGVVCGVLANLLSARVLKGL